MILSRGKHRDAEFSLPTLDDPPFALETQQHERWRSAWQDEVGVHSSKLLDFGFVDRHRCTKFFLGAAGKVRAYVDDANICRHLVIELGLSAVGSIGWADPADEIVFVRFRHSVSPVSASHIANGSTKKRLTVRESAG